MGIRQKQGKMLLKNMTIGAICKPLGMLVHFFYIPFALNYLGVEKYGVWTTILSILSWVSYCDVGVGNGLRNKLAEELVKDNKEKCRELVSSAYFISAVVVGILGTICVAISLLIDWKNVFNIGYMDENLNLIISLSIVLVCLNFILSLCKNILYALQKAALVNAMELSIQILNFVFLFLFANFTKENILVVSLIYCGSMICTNFCTGKILFYKVSYLSPSIKNINVKSSSQILKIGIVFFAMQICAMIMFTTDNIFVAHFFGAEEVTSYAMVNKLYSVIASFHLAIIAPIWSYVTMVKVEKEYRKIRQLIHKMNLVIIPFAIAIICLFFLFKPVAWIWLRKELNYSQGLILLGAVYCGLTIWCNTYAAVGNGLELLRISLIIGIIQASTNICLSLFFVKVCMMNSAGILLGTIVAMIISAIVLPVVCKRHLSVLERNQ